MKQLSNCIPALEDLQSAGVVVLWRPFHEFNEARFNIFIIVLSATPKKVLKLAAMNKDKIIKKTSAFVKEVLANAEGGHDWWHVYRVWKLARNISKSENVDLFIVELGALLHDIADSKFHNGDEEIGPQKAREFLSSLNVKKEDITHVENIIAHISFKCGRHAQNFKSPEFDVVQDADRLDALGAIGVARAFNYGGYKNREIYNPKIKPNLKVTKEEYKASKAPTLNHFYEKLLLLKGKMNSKTGKIMAKHRHKFIEKFLVEFHKEWDGEL